MDDLIRLIGDEQVRFSPRGRNIVGAVGRVDVIGDIESLCARLAGAADPRDVQAAHDSLKQILGLSQPQG